MGRFPFLENGGLTLKHLFVGLGNLMILFKEGISKNIKTCLEDGFDIDYYTLWNSIHVVNTLILL
jgi:hypothetical protein